MVSSTVRNSEDKKRGTARKNQISMCVTCLLGVLPVLLERSSQDTNHNPRLGCLLSTYTTVELHLFLFYSLCLSTFFSLCLSFYS